MAKWLDKYEAGGEYLGTTNKGFNYNGAWGGPSMQMGGELEIPQAQQGKKKNFQPSISAEPTVFLQRPSEELSLLAVPGVNVDASPTERLALSARLSSPFFFSERGISGLENFDYNVGARYRLNDNNEVGVNYGNQGIGANLTHTLFNKKKGKKKTMEMGGSVPGSVGFTYARTKDIPSEGPYGKKTVPSAQNGQEMQFYQNGLDWTPRNISEYGSEIPIGQKGKKIPDYLKGPARGDITQRGNQQLKTEIPAILSREKKAEEKVQKLVQYKNYDEKAARRAVQNKTKSGERDLKEIERVETRAAAHPDYQPGISFPQMQALSEAGDLRSRILRGSNLLTNQGTPLDFVTGLVTDPGRSFANLTLDAKNQYLNPENSALENATNLGFDLLTVAPTGVSKAVKKVASKAKPALSKLRSTIAERSLTPIGYDPMKILAAPLEVVLPKYKPKTFVTQQRTDAWRMHNNLEPKYGSFAKNADDSYSIKDFQVPEDELQYAIKSPKNRLTYTGNFGGVSGNSTIMKGVDDKGKYLEFYDIWDLQPLKTQKWLPKQVRNFEVGQLTGGKPFTTKNRIYYDDAGNFFNSDGTPLTRGQHKVILDDKGNYEMQNFLGTGKAINTKLDDAFKDWNKMSTIAYMKGVGGAAAGMGYAMNNIVQRELAKNAGAEERSKKKKEGGIVKDNDGYWNPDNWGKVVEIDSPHITMKGVDQDLIGVSDTGDVQYMTPGNDYTFEGNRVTEYPVAKYGVNQQDEKTVQHLDQLLNFTNKPKAKNGWLDKYN